MKLQNVTDASFKKYGRVLTGIDFTELIEKMGDTPCPCDPPAVVYEPSIPELEALPVYGELQKIGYGELPIEVGYCNGCNYLLNAVEYHRSSELDIGATDSILLLGWLPDVAEDFTYDTAKIEAFLLPKGVGVELYATTLHYAPCSVAEGEGFRVVIVLPRDTNLELEAQHTDGEDGHLTAKNKWLIGHPQGGLPEGAPLGLTGKNISVREEGLLR